MREQFKNLILKRFMMQKFLETIIRNNVQNLLKEFTSEYQIQCGYIVDINDNLVIIDVVCDVPKIEELAVDYIIKNCDKFYLSLSDNQPDSKSMIHFTVDFSNYLEMTQLFEILKRFESSEFKPFDYILIDCITEKFKALIPDKHKCPILNKGK